MTTPGRDQFLETAPAQLIANQAEQLFVARLNNFGEGLASKTPRWPVANAWHLDRFVRVRELRQRTGVLDLDFLGILRRRTHRYGDIVGYLVAGDRNHRGVLNGSAEEHGDVGRATTDVDDARAEFLLVVSQNRVARRQLFEHDVIDFEAAALHALDDVLRGAFRAGHHVNFGLQTHTGHADRLANTLLAVDQEFLGQDVQYLLVGRNGDGARRIDDPVDVGRADFRYHESRRCRENSGCERGCRRYRCTPSGCRSRP